MNGIWADLSTPLIMGILLGGLYTVIALGLSLVFGVMRLLNVAHGDLVIFGSYFAYAIITFSGIDPILSLVMGVPLLFGIGFEGIWKELVLLAVLCLIIFIIILMVE